MNQTQSKPIIPIIRLHLRTTGRAPGWIAEFEGDAKIQEFFGTTFIPTPFTPASSFLTVATRIRELNPEHEVVLALGERSWDPTN